MYGMGYLLGCVPAKAGVEDVFGVFHGTWRLVARQCSVGQRNLFRDHNIKYACPRMAKLQQSYDYTNC